MHHVGTLVISLLYRYGVGAHRIGAWTRLELLPGPFRFYFYRYVYYWFDFYIAGRIKWLFYRTPISTGHFNAFLLPWLITLEDEIPRVCFRKCRSRSRCFWHLLCISLPRPIYICIVFVFSHVRWTEGNRRTRISGTSTVKAGSGLVSGLFHSRGILTTPPLSSSNPEKCGGLRVLQCSACLDLWFQRVQKAHAGEYSAYVLRARSDMEDVEGWNEPRMIWCKMQ